jgi:hypothetical protein
VKVGGDAFAVPERIDVDPEAEAPLRFLGSTGAVNGGAAAARRLHERAFTVTP